MRRSNETVPHAGYVYWQTADWLIAEGLASFEVGSGAMFLLTGKGLELANEVL